MMRAFASGLMGGITAVVLLVGLMGQTIIGGGGGVSVPTAGIILDDSGGCPSGYTEVTAARGRYLVGVPSGGTVAGTLGSAMADVADASYTPAGTNGTAAFTPAGTNGTAAFTPAGTNGTAAFTPAGTMDSVSAGTPSGSLSMDALGSHAHNLPINTDGTYHFIGTVYGTGATANIGVREGAFTSNSNNAVTSLSDTASAGTPTGTFSGSALSSHTHTFTGSPGTVPAQTFTGSPGTVPAQTFTGSPGTVPAQTFTGTATTTMRSSVAPTLQLTLCKRS